MIVYVYFIQKGYGSFKIGVSVDPEKRLSALQTANHAELFLIAKFPFSSRSEAMQVEKSLHRKFARFRLEGEWFRRGALRELKNRSTLLPKIFSGGKMNNYHEGYVPAKRMEDVC